MELGIISWIEEENFRKAKELGLSFVELDVNDRAEEFLSHLDQVISFSKAYEMPVGAMGRWGSDRINKDGIRQEELELEYRLIDAASRLECGVYITGCNYVEELSYYENCSFAIAYFEKLIARGKEKGVKIASPVSSPFLYLFSTVVHATTSLVTSILSHTNPLAVDGWQSLLN